MSHKPRGFEVRDLRKKQFFVVDDIYVNGFARLLGPFVTSTYLSICRHVDKGQSCFPSQKLIADEQGMSERTVVRAIKTLIDLNLIRMKRVRAKSGKWLHNRYFLVDKKHWLRPHAPESHGLTIRQKQQNHTTVSHTKYTHKKYTHTLSTQKKYLHPLKANIDEEYLQALAERNNVPINFVKSKFDDMVLWHEQNPYKNKKISWKATLATWVKKDQLKIRERSGYANRTRGIDATNL